MEEIWKAIPGYEISYEASSFGRIRRIGFGRGVKSMRIIRPWTGNHQYFVLRLCKNCVKKTFLVHRLVAMTFIENSDESLSVNHKDFNRKNNHVDNLEWLTHIENIRHAIPRMGKHKGESHKKAKLKICDVKEIRGLYEKGGQSIADIARQYSITAPACSCVIHRKTWKHVD